MAKPAGGQPLLDHVQKLKRRYEALKSSSERTNCETHWQEIAEVISPRKVNFVGIRTPGEKKMNKVYDPTGILANEMLAAGLHGMATNPSTQWFDLRMVGVRVPGPDGEDVDINEAPEVQDYLTDTREIMWQRLYQPGTNFTTALHEAYLDLGAFGTAIVFLGQRDAGGLLFETRPLAECLFAENAEGRVDTVFRRTTYTVRQMMQMARSQNWKVSEKVKNLYEDQKYDDPVEVIHAVYPRIEREHGKRDVANMPYASCYFEREEATELEMSGFPEFPYLIARWSKYAGEVYGRGPGMTALPDVKMLQAMVLTKIKLMQKAADPPMWLRDDGVIGPTRTIPGGVNYWRGNPNDGVMLQPVSLQGLQFLAEDTQALRQQILRTFYADLMRMEDRPDMTATEVVQRTSEQMRLFGPLIGRLESEMLGPLVERVFGILTREGLLPDPPDVIQEQEFTVEYVSPIATAQKQQAANGIVQVMQMLGAFGPDIAAQIVQQNVDIEKLFKWLWDLFNNDPDLLKDDDELEQGAQINQAQTMLQLAQPAADIAAKGSQAIKNVADGAATQGADLKQLMGRMLTQFQQAPQAQQKVREVVEQSGVDPQAMQEMMRAT